MCDALRDLMREEIAEEKKRAREEGIQEGIQEGIREGMREGRQEGMLVTIKNLMANMKWSAEQAMSAMSIPIEKQEFYKAKL